MSLRTRRLFYVAKFAGVAVLGQMPNPVYLKDTLRAILLATAKYESTGVFEVPNGRFSKKEAFRDDVEYVIMTKKGLYRLSEKEFLELDDTETCSFGVFASVFNVVYAKIKNIEKAFEKIREYSSFLVKENIVVARADLGDSIDLTAEDNFETSYRVDPR